MVAWTTTHSVSVRVSSSAMQKRTHHIVYRHTVDGNREHDTECVSGAVMVKKYVFRCTVIGRGLQISLVITS
jgi:hypothetical protein